MSDAYQRAFGLFPNFLRKRIHPLESAIQSFASGAALGSPGKKVLDAGAGEGRLRPIFRQHCYTAIDAGIGDPNWNYSGLDAVADLALLPLATNSIDVAINTQVLEHVISPSDVLTEIARVLKPGGQLFMTAPQGWHEHQQPNDFYRFTQFSLMDLMDRAGFEQVEIRPLGGFFHYLGHRLTYIPKIVFGERKGLIRYVLLPLEILALAIFCFLLPIVCYYADRLDHKKEFTLGYSCYGTKNQNCLPAKGLVETVALD